MIEELVKDNMPTQPAATRILVVEDNPSLADPLRMRLQAKGYQVESAASGCAALAGVSAQAPHLLILDYRLPDMTAEALIAALAREAHALPCLVITGAGDEQAAVEMLKLGAYDYLVEDARLADRLLAAVDRLVEQLALETRLAEAESALRESRELFRSFVHQSADGIALVDEQGLFMEWNGSMEQLTGVKREAALGRPAWEVLAELVVEGKRTPGWSEQMKALFQAALQAGQAPFFNRPMEVVIQRADGTRRIVRQRAFPIPASRGFRIGVIDRDITRQKRMEAALRESETLNPEDEAAALVQDALHLPESRNRGEGEDVFARILP